MFIAHLRGRLAQRTANNFLNYTTVQPLQKELSGSTYSLISFPKIGCVDS